MCGLPYGRVVHVEIAADGAHHDFTGVQANPHLDGYAPSPLHFCSILVP
jgi:hypothetical protein